MQHFNCRFTSYRRTTSGAARVYSGTATITAGSGYIQPASGELRSVLGLDKAVKAFVLRTPESNFSIMDKLTMTTENSNDDGDYYVEQCEIQSVNGTPFAMLLITKDR